ncbi:aspartate--ammonia ligase [Erysipelotrichaceae bacterium OttesenSCG-928-M19]|nr:aspartate--ammonia ligase [Erysipelotrichaceae bacterium OttesenSCG-928-M19]
MTLKLDKDYQPKMNVIETQKAIKEVKDYFDKHFAEKLSLTRVPAPLFVQGDSGLNDNLSGVETPVTFSTADMSNLQIVHSLAKWKRKALKRYFFEKGTGLYTDMNAIRKHEDLSNIHSLYVDQWDWEKIINRDERTDEMLEKIVKDIFEVFKMTEEYINALYPQLTRKLPDEIFFITSQELYDLYPDLDDKGRENAIVKEHKAVFIKQIGKKLSNGMPHDMRAPDYDDWELNGDIIFYNPILDSGIELSSMGIRVDEKSLLKQLEAADAMDRATLPYHQDVLNRQLPQTVGGGIGQSRLCMFFLEKMHIGEVQSSIWSKEMVEKCEEHNIILL